MLSEGRCSWRGAGMDVLHLFFLEQNAQSAKYSVGINGACFDALLRCTRLQDGRWEHMCEAGDSLLRTCQQARSARGSSRLHVHMHARPFTKRALIACQ